LGLVEWFSKGPVARRFIELCALVLIGISLARVFWILVSPVGAVASVTPEPSVGVLSVATRSTVSADRSILLRKNAFEAGDAPAEPSAPDEAPETSLNLKLKGQRAVTGQGLGTATIVTPDNQQGVFEEGEEILDGVGLSRVLSDRVILERDGRVESLFREGRDGALNVLGDAEEPRQTVANGEVVEGSVYRVSSLAALQGATRLERSTGPAGWRFRAVGDPAMLRSAGIYDGDLLVAVDGNPAESLTYQSVLSLLEEKDRVNLSIRRGGQTLNLTLVFEEPIQ